MVACDGIARNCDLRIANSQFSIDMRLHQPDVCIEIGEQSLRQPDVCIEIGEQSLR